MIMNILVILKTILYVNITEIQFNKFLVFLLTSLISVIILELIKKRKSRHRGKMRIGFYSLLSLIMFVDAMYFMQFSTLPSISLLKQFNQLSTVGDSIKYLLNIKNILLLIDIPVIIYFYIKNRDEKEKYEINNITLKVSTVLLALSLIGIILIGESESVMSQELYTYHLTDIVDTLLGREETDIISDEDIRELEMRTQLEQGKFTGLGKDKNLISVQVEALQNFVIGLEYEGQEITPELNRLIQDQSTVYYDNYYQLVGRGNTSDAEFVTHNSFHPSMEEHSYSRFEKNEFYGLPMLLRDNGYKTVAMHGNDGEYWNRRAAYKGQGFDEFLDIQYYQVDELLGMGVSDKDFFEQNVQYLSQYKRENENPFYAFMATLTSHTPYNMPESYKILDIREEHVDTILGNYLQSIHYADKQIGFLIEELKSEGLYEDTVIALYGDHYAISLTNEEDRDLMSDFFGYEYDYDEMMNIPLVLHIPGEEIHETISEIGSQIDFFPTILNIMGYKNEKGLLFGRDISNYKGYNFVSPQTYMRKGSFIDGENTFVISRDGIFQHSRAFNNRTREEIEDLEQLRKTHEMAIREINLSDYILNQNLLKEYIGNGGNIDLENFKGDSELEILKIYELKKNSLEELNRVYESGERVIGFDLKLNSEDQVVLVGENVLTLDELSQWLVTHRDVKVILKAAEDEVETLTKAYDSSELEGAVAMIRDFGSYLEMTNNRYGEVILDPFEKEYNSEELIDFIDRYPSISILVDMEIQDKKLEELTRRGIDIYKYIQ